MSKNRQLPLIIFIIMLLMVSLACQLTSLEPETVNEDAIVAQVVATVQAQTATNAATIPIADGETALGL